MLTSAELRLLLEALYTLTAEYGERAEATALIEKLTTWRESLEES